MSARAIERRAIVGATATGFLVLVAHGLLETARDALFLTHVPASRLPWMYLTLALGGLSVSEITVRSGGRFDARRMLLASQAVAAAGTVAVALLVSTAAPAVYYVLYLWVGIASMSVLVRYWQHLAGSFTATRAKRLFPWIGTGSIAGALAGYALAEALSRTVGVRASIPVAAAFFAASMVGPLWFFTGGANVAGVEDSSRGVRVADKLRTIWSHAYLRRLAVVLVVASVTVTLADFVFKSVVARDVPADELGSFFARAYFAFNVASLLILVVAVNPIVQRIGVTATLAVLPAALFVGGIGMLVSGGLLAAVALKSVDGALRWSSHKTAVELLYVPLSGGLRNSVKGALDVITHRSGQVVGSVLILLVLALTDSVRVPAAFVVALAAAWILAALALREDYLDLFRATLNRGPESAAIAFPDLDVGSLETLVAALNSPIEEKVVAAMDVLEQKGKTHLIPALVLYHPAPSVVVRALDLFARARRRDVLPHLSRLAEHEYAEVRAAALRASTALQPDESTLRKALEHHCPVVNVTALVGLTVGGWMLPETGIAELLRHADADSELARPMIARAIRYQPVPAFAPVLFRLARDPDPDTRKEAVRAMHAAHDVRYVPALVEALAERGLREDARDALVALGAPALAVLDRVLGDRETPLALRAHLPRTVARFQTKRAAEILLRRLREEPSGMVRFKVLRGLGRMLANDPTLRLDNAVLDEVIERTTVQLYERSAWQRVLVDGATQRPILRTPGHELLLQLLRDKEELALERLFRVVGLRYRGEDWADLYEGVTSDDAIARSSGHELLESALPRRLAAAVLGLLSDVGSDERREAGEGVHPTREPGYEDLIEHLCAERGDTLRLIARYHAVEIGLRADVRRLFEPADEAPWREPVRRLAEKMQRDLPPRQTEVAGRA